MDLANPRQADLAGVHQLLQGHTQRGFQANDPERAFLELLQLFTTGVRRMVGCDGVDALVLVLTLRYGRSLDAVCPSVD